MNNNSFVWIRFGTGQPFKVSIADGQDVADVIEAAKNKLGLSDRLDELYVFLKDTDESTQQRPGKLITELLEENYPVGRNDRHPLLIRKVNQSIWYPEHWSIPQNIPIQEINFVLESEWNSIKWFTFAFIALVVSDLEEFSPFSATFLFIMLKIIVYAIYMAILRWKEGISPVHGIIFCRKDTGPLSHHPWRMQI